MREAQQGNKAGPRTRRPPPSSNPTLSSSVVRRVVQSSVADVLASSTMDPRSLTTDDWRAFTERANQPLDFSALAVKSSIVGAPLAPKPKKSPKAARRRGVRMETISRADAHDVCNEVRRVSSSCSPSQEDDFLQTRPGSPRPDGAKLYRCAVPECPTKGSFLGPQTMHMHMKSCHFPFAEGFPSWLRKRKSKATRSSHRADKRRSNLAYPLSDNPLRSDHYSMVERRILRTAIRHRTFKALEETQGGRRVAVEVSMDDSITEAGRGPSSGFLMMIG